MMSRCLMLALAATALAQPALAQGSAFRDDFDTFDEARWYASDGWSNGSHQNCTWSADQAKTGDGKLELGFAPQPTGDRQYRCGEIQTRSAYGYGTFEARMKTPAGSGLNAAFFSYIGAQQGKPHDEIDFEVLLRDTGHVDTTTFVDGVSGDGEVGAGQSHALPRSSDSDFLTYAFTWAPGQVRFYVDGVLLRTIDDPAMVPENPQRIFFSLWGSDTLTDWMGDFAPMGGPVALEVDWVAFTPLGEDCAFDDSILCQGDK